jgi:hypothetical protein
MLKLAAVAAHLSVLAKHFMVDLAAAVLVAAAVVVLLVQGVPLQSETYFGLFIPHRGR